MQKIVQELADAIGLADAIVIVRKWGGRELYVPKTVRHDDALALTLGLQTAQRLVSFFGGGYIKLPAERNALLDLRNEAICQAIESGESPGSVGLEFGLTRQMVVRISRAAKERGSFTGPNDKSEA